MEAKGGKRSEGEGFLSVGWQAHEKLRTISCIPHVGHRAAVSVSVASNPFGCCLGVHMRLIMPKGPAPHPI